MSQSGEPKIQKETTIYENRILAFVDILGFQTMIGTSAVDLQEQKRISIAMETIHSYKMLNDASNIGLKMLGAQVTTFSDSAIISYPVSFDGGLFHVLMDLIHLQIDLANLGIFIRGGVAIGLAHHDEVNAYGPAMVEAYELESQKAVYPRIILTDQTLGIGCAASRNHQDSYDMALLHSLIKRDEDGYYYLDFLRQSQELNYPEQDYYRLLTRIRKSLIYNLNLYHAEERIFQKYKWLLAYWNDVLNPQSFHALVEDGISEEEAKDIFESYTRLKIKDEYPYR